MRAPRWLLALGLGLSLAGTGSAQGQPATAPAAAPPPAAPAASPPAPAAPAAQRPTAAAPKPAAPPGSPASPSSAAAPAPASPSRAAGQPAAGPSPASGQAAASPSPTPGDPAAAGADADPHAGQPQRRADVNQLAPDLPAGTIEARIVDVQERPIAGRKVRLGIMKQSIAEGNERSERFATTDENGLVRFSDLVRDSAHAYRVTVDEGPAHYASSPFNLGNDGGQRVLLHVYPVSYDIESTGVATRAIVYVEPRDDVFQLEVMFRIFNVGVVTWVPQNLVLQLPPAAKGFATGEAMTDARAVKVDDRNVRIEGTYGPGQHDVSFRFQIPNEHESSFRFSLPMPPRVAELRVMAESSSGMQLEADGFPPAEPTANQRGQRILLTGRQIQSLTDPPLSQLDVTLSGIPTPGPGRWGAVIIALLLGASGLFVATRRRTRTAPQTLGKQELSRARDVLLDELLSLERAKRAEDIGPQTYESVRRTLLDALLRIEQRKAPRAGGPYRSGEATTSEG